MEADVEIINNRSTPLFFAKGLQGEPTTLVFSIEKGKKQVKVDVVEHLTASVPPSGSTKSKLRFSTTDLPPGNYNIYFGIRNGVLPDAILSEGIAFDKE